MTKRKPTAKRKPARRRRAATLPLPRFAYPGELSDLNLLPNRFERFASETRDSFKLLGDRILPSLERIEEAITSLTGRVGELEKAQYRTDDRLAALEAARTQIDTTTE